MTGRASPSSTGAPAAGRYAILSLFPELVRDKYAGPLPSSVQHGTNADAVHDLRNVYFRDGRRIVDLTYGAGGWWKRHRPDGLEISTSDFTALPYPDGAFDTVCYDPPYIPHSGTSTSPNADAFRDRFGLTKRTGPELLAMILAGADEAARITEPAAGFLVVKCMDFVDASRFHSWSYLIVAHLNAAGLVLHDEIVHAAGAGIGGHNIAEPKRARRSHSKFLVFTWTPR